MSTFGRGEGRRIKGEPRVNGNGLHIQMAGVPSRLAYTGRVSFRCIATAHSVGITRSRHSEGSADSQKPEIREA